MASIITGLDTHTPLRTGENNHTERSYSNELNEQVVQFFFQLVRCEDHTKLQSIHKNILLTIKGDLETHHDILITMYKLIGQTRDIISGKGEQKLAFMQIMGFYDTGFEKLAINAITHFVHRANDEHPFGSWKDIKYFCQYVNDCTHNENHPLITNTWRLIVDQLNQDWMAYENWSSVSSTSVPAPKFTLAGRWCPRGKSQHTWLHNIIAKGMFPKYMSTAKTESSRTKALNKCRIKLSKRITTLNRALDTTQIKQCNGDWRGINFNKVTSATMRKQSIAFANKKKDGEARSCSFDRIECANNLSNHFSACKEDPVKNKVHGRRLNVYELTKDAYNITGSSGVEHDRINLQWEDNKKNNKGLGAFIPCSDISYSMHDCAMVPLFSSIGLGIRASEMTHPAFRNRVLTFGDQPQWHIFGEGENFTDKVQKIKNVSTGLGTNFYRALKMILDVIIQNEIPPKDVESMILGVFSDMQINAVMRSCNTISKDMQDHIIPGATIMDTMFNVIEKMYADAGMRSKYKQQYKAPHILLWNLRNTDGFPVSSTTKNVTMLSGFSSVLLNAVCDKGIDSLKEFTPRRMLRDILNCERYAVLENDVRDYIISKTVG